MTECEFYAHLAALRDDMRTLLKHAKHRNRPCYDEARFVLWDLENFLDGARITRGDH